LSSASAESTGLESNRTTPHARGRLENSRVGRPVVLLRHKRTQCLRRTNRPRINSNRTTPARGQSLRDSRLRVVRCSAPAQDK
jgi:hypothetical protein